MSLRRFTLVAIGLLLISISLSAQPTSPRQVYVLPVNSDIEPNLAALINRGVEEACAQNATLVVVEINTNGGLVDSMEKIAASLERLDDAGIPYVAYVREKAWSA